MQPDLLVAARLFILLRIRFFALSFAMARMLSLLQVYLRVIERVDRVLHGPFYRREVYASY